MGGLGRVGRVEPRAELNRGGGVILTGTIG